MNPLVAWHEFYVALAGASAALAGLIFVALSFNFDHIVGDRVMLSRAASGLVLLVLPVVVGLTALSPITGAVAVGAVLAAWTLLGAFSLFRLLVHAGQTHTDDLTARLPVVLASSALALAGAILIAFGVSAGPFLLALAMVVDVIVGPVMAWILQVEARRSR